MINLLFVEFFFFCILGTILFSIYINVLCVGLKTAKVHLYVQDMIIYTVAPSLKVALGSLQTGNK